MSYIMNLHPLSYANESPPPLSYANESPPPSLMLMNLHPPPLPPPQKTGPNGTYITTDVPFGEYFQNDSPPPPWTPLKRSRQFYITQPKELGTTGTL